MGTVRSRLNSNIERGCEQVFNTTNRSWRRLRRGYWHKGLSTRCRLFEKTERERAIDDHQTICKAWESYNTMGARFGVLMKEKREVNDDGDGDNDDDARDLFAWPVNLFPIEDPSDCLDLLRRINFDLRAC